MKYYKTTEVKVTFLSFFLPETSSSSSSSSFSCQTFCLCWSRVSAHTVQSFISFSKCISKPQSHVLVRCESHSFLSSFLKYFCLQLTHKSSFICCNMFPYPCKPTLTCLIGFIVWQWYSVQLIKVHNCIMKCKTVCVCL